MNEHLRIFLSTVAGEALTSSPAAWRAVASTILNRVGKREWRKHVTTTAVIRETGFDAFKFQNKPYKVAYAYFAGERVLRKSLYDALERTVTPLFLGKEWPIYGLVLYYSPKAQAALHAKYPQAYKAAVPSWAKSPLVEEVRVPGTEGDDFRWFKYKEGV